MLPHFMFVFALGIGGTAIWATCYTHSKPHLGSGVSVSGSNA